MRINRALALWRRRICCGLAPGEHGSAAAWRRCESSAAAWRRCESKRQRTRTSRTPFLLAEIYKGDPKKAAARLFFGTPFRGGLGAQPAPLRV